MRFWKPRGVEQALDAYILALLRARAVARAHDAGDASDAELTWAELTVTRIARDLNRYSAAQIHGALSNRSHR